MKLVYIVLVNYKGYKDTIECLESLLKLNYQNFKVIVVDNDSQNNSVEHILEWASLSSNINFDVPPVLNNYVYPLNDLVLDISVFDEDSLIDSFILSKFNIIKAKKNKGFAAGNNIAIRPLLSSPDCYFWLLNNDTIVDNDSLSYLVDYASKDNKIGILGSKLLYYSAPDTIQALGGILNKWNFTSTHLFEGVKDNIAIIDISPDYIVGASMFISSLFFQSVGLMDENYFIYYEETDLAIRAKKSGWLISVCQQSKVYHKEGKSIGANTKKKSFISIYYGIKNRFLLSKKFYFGRFLILFVILPYYLITLLIKKWIK